jgi:23S rRNA (pseudouridine1915-N3)-methyltransferase
VRGFPLKSRSKQLNLDRCHDFGCFHPKSSRSKERGVKLSILCVGKLKDEAERAIVARYLERLGPMGGAVGLSSAGVAEIMESRAATPQARKAAEAAELRKRLGADAKAVALDEQGRTLSSEELAEILRRWNDEGARGAAFVVGGPDGLDPAFVKSADLAFSLGRITLPHGLARAVLAEQLYRAATLIAGHPYHRA